MEIGEEGVRKRENGKIVKKSERGGYRNQIEK